jgi:hypothetical protein
MDMNKLNQMSKQAEMKERLRKKMEMKKAQQAQAQSPSASQAQAPSPSASQNPSVIPVGDKNYVVKIGTEVQAKSGLRPPAKNDLEQAPLSEEELIKLFSKKDKPLKKAK